MGIRITAISSKFGAILLFALFLSACGTESQANKACKEFLSGNIERIVPEFSELVRQNPDYEKYSNAARQYVFWSEELRQQEEDSFQYPKGELEFTYIGGQEELDKAQFMLNSFCAK